MVSLIVAGSSTCSEPLFDNTSPWTEQKADLLLVYGKCSEDNQKQVLEVSSQAFTLQNILREQETENKPSLFECGFIRIFFSETRLFSFYLPFPTAKFVTETMEYRNENKKATSIS